MPPSSLSAWLGSSRRISLCFCPLRSGGKSVCGCHSTRSSCRWCSRRSVLQRPLPEAAPASSRPAVPHAVQSTEGPTGPVDMGVRDQTMVADTEHRLVRAGRAWDAHTPFPYPRCRSSCASGPAWVLPGAAVAPALSAIRNAPIPWAPRRRSPWRYCGTSTLSQESVRPLT